MQPSYAFKEADDTDLSEYNEEIFEESTCISKGLPRIVRQPSSVQAKVGEFVNFSVLSDACSATYQWKKNGVDITDAIQKSYTIDVVVPSDSGSYTVVVKNSNGSMISDPARLEIVNEKHAFH